MILTPGDEADIRHLLDHRAKVAGAAAMGTPRHRWRATASSRPAAFDVLKDDPKTYGFIVALDSFAVVSTWNGADLNELSARLGPLPITATSRCGNMTMRWFRVPPALPSASLGADIFVRAGGEPAPLPPTPNQHGFRWRWVRRPGDVGVKELPATWIGEVRTLALGPSLGALAA